MQSNREARIRERAYQIWVAEGRTHGRQDEHWARAEREIAAEEAAQEMMPARRPRRPPNRTAVAGATPKTRPKTTGEEREAAVAKPARRRPVSAASKTEARTKAAARPRRRASQAEP